MLAAMANYRAKFFFILNCSLVADDALFFLRRLSVPTRSWSCIRLFALRYCLAVVPFFMLFAQQLSVVRHSCRTSSHSRPCLFSQQCECVRQHAGCATTSTANHVVSRVRADFAARLCPRTAQEHVWICAFEQNIIYVPWQPVNTCCVCGATCMNQDLPALLCTATYMVVLQLSI
jgi:hypothetical protein